MVKVLILIGICMLLVAVGLVWLLRAGTSTNTQVITEISDGPDRLTLTASHTSSMGNSYAARLLYFNGKLVDFRGSFPKHPEEGGKTFPLNSNGLQVDILAPENAEEMRLKEKLHRRMNPLAGTVPYDLLNHDFPNLEQGTPWTVWVNPKEFSLADYQRIVVLLGQHAHEMCLQQLAFEADSTKNPHAWLRFPGLLIWRTVYHDYSLLKNTMFERTKGKTEEQVTITPFGAVEYRQKSERYQYGFGCGLGELSENADTLFVNPYWPTFDVTFPISEFAQFKNEQGQALTDVYKVILSAEN